MGLSRKEYQSGLPLPTLADLSNPVIEPMSLAFPALAGKFFSTCATREASSLLIDSLMIREGDGTLLQYSCLENPRDVGAWWAAVLGVAESRTRLNDFTFPFMHWRRKWQPTPVFLPG